MMITTRHESGVVNAAVFGAYTNLSPTPVGIAVAKSSHTYANVLRSGEFVINVPGADMVKTLAILADDTPATRSELDEAGLCAKPGIAIKTPSIAECQAAVEFHYEQEVPIGHHNFVIGAVSGGWIRESAMDADGKIDIFKARVLKGVKYPQPLYVLPGDIVEGEAPRSILVEFAPVSFDRAIRASSACIAIARGAKACLMKHGVVMAVASCLHLDETSLAGRCVANRRSPS